MHTPGSNYKCLNYRKVYCSVYFTLIQRYNQGNEQFAICQLRQVYRQDFPALIIPFPETE